MRAFLAMLIACGLGLALAPVASAQLAGGTPIQPGADMDLDVPGDIPPVPEPPDPPGGGILDEPTDADSVVFIVDRSCSMGWGTSSIEVPGMPSATPWQAAQYELTRAVDNLDGEARFSVCLFNHSYQPWPGGTSLVPATEGNKSNARSWVMSQYATGGTTYTPACIWGINIPQGPPEVIMFLSDGYPNEGYSAVGSITAANAGRCVINTVAFGIGGEAVRIMSDIASFNGGICRVVP